MEVESQIIGSRTVSKPTCNMCDKSPGSSVESSASSIDLFATAPEVLVYPKNIKASWQHFPPSKGLCTCTTAPPPDTGSSPINTELDSVMVNFVYCQSTQEPADCVMANEDEAAARRSSRRHRSRSSMVFFPPRQRSFTESSGSIQPSGQSEAYAEKAPRGTPPSGNLIGVSEAMRRVSLELAKPVSPQKQSPTYQRKRVSENGLPIPLRRSGEVETTTERESVLLGDLLRRKSATYERRAGLNAAWGSEVNSMSSWHYSET